MRSCSRSSSRINLLKQNENFTDYNDNVKRFKSLVFILRIIYKHFPWIFGCIDIDYFAMIKEYLGEYIQITKH